MHTDIGSKCSAASRQRYLKEGCLYRPHGKFASTHGLHIVSEGDGIRLKGIVKSLIPQAFWDSWRDPEGCVTECGVVLNKGKLDNRSITYIQKQ